MKHWSSQLSSQVAKMSQSLALSNSSLASSSYLALSEDEQRKVLEHKREREARSLAVEKAYVHDVYEQISGKKSLQVTVRLVISKSIFMA